MKKRILIILPIILLLFGVGIYFYFQKVKYQDFKTLTLELQAKSQSFEETQEGVVKFNFSKASCNVFIYIAGNGVIKQSDLIIFFKSIPFESESEIKKERKEQETCLNFGLQTFTILFADKKTKQEFFKLAKKLISNLKAEQTLQSKFYSETLTISAENGELKISIN